MFLPATAFISSATSCQQKNLTRTFIYLLLVTLSTVSNCAAGAWDIECQLKDHLDPESGKLKKDSPFSIIVCKYKNLQTEQTTSISFLANPQENTLVLTDTAPSESDSLEPIAVASEDLTSTALINTAETTRPNLAFQIAIEQAIQAHANLPACGRTFPHPYAFKPIDHQLAEAARDNFDKLLGETEPPAILQALSRFRAINWIRANWDTVSAFINQYKSYLLGAAGGSSFLSIFYGAGLTKSFARFEPEPSYDFAGCLMTAEVKTNEFLSDMFYANVTIRQFTYENTLKEMDAGLVRTPVLVRTTGRFTGFSSHTANCRCPVCPGTTITAASGFDGCLVDFHIQTDALFAHLLDLTGGNMDRRLNAKIPIEGYFSEFDTPVGITTDSQCQCLPCPKQQTEASEKIGSTMLSITNWLGAAIAAATFMTAVYLIKKYCLRRHPNKLQRPLVE
ncbi:hypothetical protein [Endozoicomonas euniceicola]|uniref:Uncharacterized protein n=1 Tax=Endozoicomonas euniceicola TaxID=1234143 RepID=A0ABY6GYJ1_9GAMM|nr:hypothetical protein [Endozoicomonas euniceicola]UYM16984.1 hypothetical protein NX720_03400 [Endozoicomonas euniceicola]